MKELIESLRLGASISRERNLNLDYALKADQAADTIERLENEAVAATLRIENDAAEITKAARLEEHRCDHIRHLTAERDAYQQAADTQAAAHKVERDALTQKMADDSADANEIIQRLMKERDGLIGISEREYIKGQALIAERDALKLDAARFAYLCDCQNEQALDILCERLGQRDELIELTDALIAE